MSNSEIEQSGTVKGHLPNEASLSGRISNVLSLSGHISIGGAGDFIIKMTVARDDDGNYTVTSCDATIEQIDAAVAAEKRVVVIVSYEGAITELPMLQGVEGDTYYFGTFALGPVIISSVHKVENESKWDFSVTQIQSGDVGYSNDALPNISTIEGALDTLVPNSHAHTNKAVLDKFSETDGKPTYGGQALGGAGASDFIIKMTVTSDDEGNYTVASCDATFEQIEEAVAAEKRVVIIATETTNNIVFELPIAQAYHGVAYYFSTFVYGRNIFSAIYKEGENETWEFSITGIEAMDVTYSNNSLPDVNDVGYALDKLITKKINSAFEFIQLFDNEEYRLTDVTKLRIAYPTGDFECWIRLSFAASGDITVTLPIKTRYIGIAPDFKNGETWELSIKDGIVIAQRVGDGT